MRMLQHPQLPRLEAYEKPWLVDECRSEMPAAPVVEAANVILRGIRVVIVFPYVVFPKSWRGVSGAASQTEKIPWFVSCRVSICKEPPFDGHVERNRMSCFGLRCAPRYLLPVHELKPP